MKITIPGDPIPKARARTVRRNKKTMTYDPQEKEKINVRNKIIYETNKAIMDLSQEIHEEVSDLTKAESFQVDWSFYMPIPKSLPKSKRMALIGECVPHTSKPDVTNLIKFYEDCGNKIIFRDDAQICKGSFEKVYSENPRTVINITALNI